jgi:hypothetical protein
LNREDLENYLEIFVMGKSTERDQSLAIVDAHSAYGSDSMGEISYSGIIRMVAAIAALALLTWA